MRGKVKKTPRKGEEKQPDQDSPPSEIEEIRGDDGDEQQEKPGDDQEQQGGGHGGEDPNDQEDDQEEPPKAPKARDGKDEVEEETLSTAFAYQVLSRREPLTRFDFLNMWAVESEEGVWEFKDTPFIKENRDAG